jgi:hypothetical protein
MKKIIDIQVRSREAAKEFVDDLPWAAISISTHSQGLPELQTKNRVGLLQLTFWDIDSEDLEKNKNSFSKEDADKIINFVGDMLPKIECLLIHCEMGVSRSPAIAAALSHSLWGPETDKIYFKNYTPNMLVYRTLIETYNERCSSIKHA